MIKKKEETVDLENEFEPRADYIPEGELRENTAVTDFFEDVQKKLMRSGTHLIVGPRGCGKTHMMRYTWLSCLENQSYPFCIYVTFNRYYRLEPLLKSRSNAIDLFHVWVLARILMGLFATVEEIDRQDSKVKQSSFLDKSLFNKEAIGFGENELILLVGKLERNFALSESENELASSLTIDAVKDVILRLTQLAGRKRAVLLLDDAALTLTPEYLKEFFDILRVMKSPYLAPKASVYPGTTDYGPRFHPKQEATEIPLWLDVEDTDYSKIMGKIAACRVANLDNIPPDVVELFKYAAFGIPRSYLQMLHDYQEKPRSTSQQAFNKIIQDFIEGRRAEFQSLALKVPRFATLIKSGEDVFRKMVAEIKKANDELINKAVAGEKGEIQLRIGIDKETIITYAERMFRLLIEAGLLFEKSEVSHGTDRKYRRYIPHLAALLQVRAFSGASRGMSPGQIVDILKQTAAKHPVRRSLQNLMGSTELNNLGFDTPPCNSCGTKRLRDDQKFCHACGTELVDSSTYSHCMSISLDTVPNITEYQRNQIKKDLPNLRTIGDILVYQDPGSELRRAYGIGPVKATRILESVTRFVDEFLY